MNKEFIYAGCKIKIYFFDEDFQPYEAWCDHQFVGSFDTLEEAEKAAKWHARHMA